MQPQVTVHVPPANGLHRPLRSMDTPIGLRHLKKGEIICLHPPEDLWTDAYTPRPLGS